MYHISNDKRAKKSAYLIAEGLLKCLKTMDFENITISDISKASTVSRATFYRLFDNTMDVAEYLWDVQFQNLLDDYYQNRLPSDKSPMIIFLERLMQQSLLIDIVTKAQRMDIIYKSHLKYVRFMSDEYLSETNYTEREWTFLSGILAGQLCGLLSTWCLQGRKETPEELMQQMISCNEIFNDLVKKTSEKT